MPAELSIKECLDVDFQASLKNGKKLTVSTLRLINTSICESEKAQRSTDNDYCITNAEIINLLIEMRKARLESAKVFENIGKIELAGREYDEIKIIEKYLPKQIIGQELVEIIDKTIIEEKVISVKDMGKCLKALRLSYPNNIDYVQVANILRDKLSG